MLNHPVTRQLPKEGVQVGLHKDQEHDTPDALTMEKKIPVTIPYVIYYLASERPLHIPKRAVMAHPNEDEPVMDVIEIAETVEEAQETTQYRNHLPS